MLSNPLTRYRFCPPACGEPFPVESGIRTRTRTSLYNSEGRPVLVTIAGFGIASVLFLLLAGCNKGRNIAARVTDLPIAEDHRTLAIEAVNKLREVFNNGGCQSIYNGAAQSFRSQPREHWLSQCEQLRESLGPWRSFNAQSTIRCGAPEAVVCVDGSSVFAKGNRSMEVAWQWDGGQAQLLWLDLLDGNHRVLIPPLPGRQYLDSPPRNHRDAMRTDKAR